MAEEMILNRLIIEQGDKEYVFEGGGGGQPAPNTVGTEQIIDGSVNEADLDDSVKAKIQKTYVEGDETLLMDYDIAGVQASNQAIVVEEEEEP